MADYVLWTEMLIHSIGRGRCRAPGDRREGQLPHLQGPLGRARLQREVRQHVRAVDGVRFRDVLLGILCTNASLNFSFVLLPILSNLM